MSSMAIVLPSLNAVNEKTEQVRRKQRRLPILSPWLLLVRTTRDLNDVNSYVVSLIALLADGSLGDASAEDLRRIAEAVSDTATRFREMLARYQPERLLGLPWLFSFPYKSVLGRSIQLSERLNGIVEGIHLGLNEDFAVLVGEAVVEAHSEVSNRA
jgi:hypothetical protein